MNNNLENIYLYGTDYIKQRLAYNSDYGRAVNECKAAEEALKTSLDETQRKLYLHLINAEDTLREQACASAFAGGYRFRAMLSSAMLD